jgi:predicted membrane-bound spermidine synthase
MNERRTFQGVFVVSLCVLMLQLALTRLFSATMYYHFAFLAISLALFGAGASGVAVYLLAGRVDTLRRPEWLSASAVLAAATTVLALVTVLGQPLSPGGPWATVLVRLSLVYLAASLPFFCAGAAIALAVTAYPHHMSRLYLYDLTGAASACLLVIPVLNRLGAVDGILLIAVLLAMAALIFQSADAVPRWQSGALAVMLAGFFGLLALHVRTGWLDVRQAKGVEERGHVIFSKWNSFSRVTVWGSLRDSALLLIIDADANTLLWRGGADHLRDRQLVQRADAVVHLLRPGARTLILGAGGGQDVIVSRLMGTREVTAVEVNPIIAGDVASTEPFLSFSGRLFRQPGVRLVVDEGRSFVRHSGDRWDVIQATMVDTWAATAAGAFALTENNLYTVEAFKDYLKHLEPDGLLSFTRWYTTPPDQLLRLLVLARTAMAELGISHPSVTSSGAGAGLLRAGPHRPRCSSRSPSSPTRRCGPCRGSPNRRASSCSTRHWSARRGCSRT